MNSRAGAEESITWAHFYEKWVVAIALIVFLLGLSLFLWGRHQHQEILEKLGEFILLVVSLHFLYEVFVKRVDRSALNESMRRLIAPQQTTLDSLSSTLARLDRQFSAAFNIVRYTNCAYFEATWSRIVTDYDCLAMIGDCSPDLWMATMDRLGDKKKLSILTSVCLDNKNALEQLLMNLRERAHTVQIRHVERLDFSFIALGWNRQTSAAEVLVAHRVVHSDSEGNQEDVTRSGHHLSGGVALEVLQSLLPYITNHAVQEFERLKPVRICDVELLNYLIEVRETYVEEVNLLALGVPISGCEAICERMSNLLRSTTKSLLVTHIASTPENVALLEEKAFRDWLTINIEAAKRGVSITRVFLISQEFVGDPRVQAAVDAMQSNNITVMYYPWERVPSQWRYDFSVYDNEHVIYIATLEGGGWIRKGVEKARVSADPDTIARFANKFKEIRRGARAFTVTQTIQN